jgi:hypothetical protein
MAEEAVANKVEEKAAAEQAHAGDLGRVDSMHNMSTAAQSRTTRGSRLRSRNQSVCGGNLKLNPNGGYFRPLTDEEVQREKEHYQHEFQQGRHAIRDPPWESQNYPAVPQFKPKLWRSESLRDVVLDLLKVIDCPRLSCAAQFLLPCAVQMH